MIYLDKMDLDWIRDYLYNVDINVDVYDYFIIIINCCTENEEVKKFVLNCQDLFEKYGYEHITWDLVETLKYPECNGFFANIFWMCVEKYLSRMFKLKPRIRDLEQQQKDYFYQAFYLAFVYYSNQK